jgi:hypothetical protein
MLAEAMLTVGLRPYPRRVLISPVDQPGTPDAGHVMSVDEPDVVGRGRDLR